MTTWQLPADRWFFVAQPFVNPALQSNSRFRGCRVPGFRSGFWARQKDRRPHPRPWDWNPTVKVFPHLGIRNRSVKSHVGPSISLPFPIHFRKALKIQEREFGPGHCLLAPALQSSAKAFGEVLRRPKPRSKAGFGSRQGIMPYAGGCAVWSVCNYKILQTQIVMVACMYTVIIFMTSSHFLRCSVSLRLRYGQPWLRSVRCEASRGNHCEAPAGENPALAQPPEVGLSGNLQGPGLGCWGKGGDRM